MSLHLAAYPTWVPPLETVTFGVFIVQPNTCCNGITIIIIISQETVRGCPLDRDTSRELFTRWIADWLAGSGRMNRPFNGSFSDFYYLLVTRRTNVNPGSSGCLMLLYIPTH